MTRSEIRDQFLPWTGLLTGFAGWAITHQFGADSTFDNCAVAVPGPVLIVALLGIAAAVWGGLMSWGVLRDDKEAPARQVVASISVGAAALFVLAMLLPMIAALVIPPCFQ
jgi:hypothetical protein